MALSLVKILIRLIYLTKPRTPWLVDCYVPIGMGLVAFSLLAATTLGPPCVAQGFADNDANLKTLPQVADGFRIELVASEPLVRNPCSLAFDVRGRLFVGMGPQYRNPRPDTPGDSVMMLSDTDGDGRFDHQTEFATGLNCIQGMAWHAGELWLANAPDLTIVRDTNGDDVADEFVKVYTDLGNIEHGLHGLNWGPDGRLYMSKGNSKGLTQPGRVAPKAFRELWGVTAPAGTPDIPESRMFAPSDYKNTYQDPADDWGREGGVLVCDEDGQNLDIISRGFRNPWDISYDDTFTWQGTDNDQNEGDRVFMPFRGAHFGWGHPWSANWTGHDHLPTAPITGKVFHGSGTGIVFYNAGQFPKSHRGVWFFNDWLRKTTFLYRPKYDGALLQPDPSDWIEFVTGGDALYRPTDIEVGPDGKLYILGWGTEYGVKWDDDQQMANEGRIFRVAWTGSQDTSDASTNSPFKESAYQKPFAQWKTTDLVQVFRSPIPARRIAAQRELLRRGGAAQAALRSAIRDNHVSPSVETWSLWTLGRMADGVADARRWLHSSGRLNLTIQALRILGHRARARGEALPSDILHMLNNPEPRVRLATLLAIQEAKSNVADRMVFSQALNDLAAVETDRVTFYATWQTHRRLVDDRYQLAFLKSERAGVRLAGLLALAENRALTDDEVTPLINDTDKRIRAVAALWLARKNGNSLLVFDPPSQEFEDELRIGLTPGIKPADVRYTTDGSDPTLDSNRWRDDLRIQATTELRVALFSGQNQIGPVAVMRYERISQQEADLRSGILDVTTKTGQRSRIIEGGLAPGKRVYADRRYTFEAVPDELANLTALQLANDDSGSDGDHYMNFETVTPITLYVGHDTRIAEPPAWLAKRESGFSPTDLRITTNDAEFRVYQKDFPTGPVQLGGNSTDGDGGGKSNYIVAVRRRPLSPRKEIATVEDVLARLPQANVERGKALFYVDGGGTCATCHRADKTGLGYGPDLSHLVQRNDPRHVAQSILTPSATITEGFVEQAIDTKSGQTITGLLRAETNAGITLIQKDGQTVFVKTSDIARRATQQISPMPVFADLLDAQQAADLTAWLLMRAAESTAADAPFDPETAKFAIESKSDRLNVTVNGKAFGSYLFAHNELTRPAWIGIHSHSGVPVTREFPATGDDVDHRYMHPGIWISFGHLNGQDYWRMRARTRHERFLEAPRADGNRASFVALNSYLSADGRSIMCRETIRYALSVHESGVLMRVESRFENPAADFYFGDQEESGLAFRVTPELSVEGGTGTIRNHHGDRNGRQVWGKQTKWVHYAGRSGERHVGIFVRPHSTNARDCWMHARDYGVVACNPFPRQPEERREPYTKTWVRKGDVYRLGYDVLIHDTREEFDPRSVVPPLK